MVERNESSSSTDATTATPNYYAKGNVEKQIETPVMRKRLEKRRQLTGSANTGAERLVIVLVGLPARGKSFIARKLLNYLTWRGNQCRIFNVGKYRRQAAAELQQEMDNSKTTNENNNDNAGDSSERFGCDANFFDESNHEAARLRQKVAEVALHDALDWLLDNNTNDNSSCDDSISTGSASARSLNNLQLEDDMYFTSGHESHGARRQFHKIALYDATNSTVSRRQWILSECAKFDKNSSAKRTGVMFIESICDDEELLAENLNFKIVSSPDFEGMSHQEALADLQERIQRYEARYESIQDHHQSYIKIFNLSSRLMVNHIYGRLAKVVLPAIMAWNTGSRPVFLCRAAETKAMERYRVEEQRKKEQREKLGLAHTSKDKFEAMFRMRSDRLGERGLQFRSALCDYIEKEGIEFMNRKNTNVAHPSKMDTGTSISGLYEERDRAFESENQEPFPCLVMSSTMPRAVETATWRHHFHVKDVSNLNPLDMGDFAGMDLAGIRQKHPEWYEQLKREPFHTRFPGGESYSDVIDRLYSIVIDMEQQLGLACVISHVSILQVLVSYFRATPVRECMDIEIPMHTVFKFEPLRGGGWQESQHQLIPPDDTGGGSVAEPVVVDPPAGNNELPIWGDSFSCLPQKL